MKELLFRFRAMKEGVAAVPVKDILEGIYSAEDSVDKVIKGIKTLSGDRFKLDPPPNKLIHILAGIIDDLGKVESYLKDYKF